MIKRKVLSITLSMALLIGMFCIGGQTNRASASTAGHTAHNIGTGTSFDNNPLKGFVPFDGSTTTFPHSLEWFYISVREVQTGMNTFNWTALENRLNAIAARGHQAVFRFYYDYPSMSTGVPQFLIDAGVTMRYYNEPANLGGGGYCPDYENQTFRTSMKNFISAFGAKYDGDSRIGFITLGLLGFWGEWHNWPYDADTSDGKPNWDISTTVLSEVLTAFDTAFNKTELCVREPKSGVPNASSDIGYHDDSFGYATLSAAAGGQTWSYGQKLVEQNQQNRWQTNCIGGEIYPPDQTSIFTNTPWQGSTGQTWQACLNEARPSWLMCEQIKNYSGSTLANAKIASKQMGYDFQVATAYYDNISISNSLYLGIDIKNIGIAPFYYDHTMWPVQVGVKQGGTLVKSWNTTWDLNTIPANASIKTFEFTASNPGLAQGTYNMCIKVINPLANGNKLGFANSGQNADGWLDLGAFTVTASNPTPTPIPGGITYYEAEASGNTLAGGAIRATASTCSGGSKVGYVGNNSGTLQFNNVNAASSGNYTLTIYYLSGEARNATMSINGGAGTTVSFSSLGNWTTVGTKEVTVYLNQGSNNIKFYNTSSWAPDFDRISVNTGSTSTPTPSPTPTPGATITIDGNAGEWGSTAAISTATGQSATSIKVTNDQNYIYFCIQGSNMGQNDEIFIDTDNNSSTGYIDWAWTNTGCDYMIENGTLYSHPTNSSAWEWTNLGSQNVTVSKNSNVKELRVAKSALGNVNGTIKVGYKDINDSWNTIATLPVSGSLPSYTLK